MDTEKNAALNTGLLFISSYHAVNTVMFARDESSFSLPSPFVTEKENRLAALALSSAEDKTALFLQDFRRVCYLILTLEDTASLIGPYRLIDTSGHEMPARFHGEGEGRAKFLSYYRSLPSFTEEQVKFMARTVFVSIYGWNVFTTERSLPLEEYKKGELPPLQEEKAYSDEMSENLSSNGIMFYYMEQVASGNYERALAAFRRMMHGRGKSFMLLHTIEGTSRLRTLTAVALHTARVPDTSAEALLNDYKQKIRSITDLDESRRLSVRMIEQSCALVRATWAGDYSQSVGLALDYIHRNLSHPLTVTEIAAFVGLTPNCFSSKFHDEVGMPATQYINEQRMKTAAQLLVYTNLSINDVCSHIGMLDSNYFSRCFRKAYGVSPSEYRKNNGPNHP